jgi:hypothetical protein
MKLGKRLKIELTPKERQDAVGNAVVEILNKYKCRIEIGHQILIVPLDPQPTPPKEPKIVK